MSGDPLVDSLDDQGHRLELVAAVDAERGIGAGGDLPWHLPTDMAHFRKLTRRAPEDRVNAVIMGRKTWASIPDRFRPLKGRLNIVLSRASTMDLPDGVVHAQSLDAALTVVDTSTDIHRVFVIGGNSVYAAALEHKSCGRLHLTRVHDTFDCDVFFPEWTGFERTETSEPFQDGEIEFHFEIWSPAGRAGEDEVVRQPRT